ncbi:hypothetical protein RchiOBHm_Chr1g0374311 [Rosa chinensis]|uniref:Uncharacterized protein n=1 Tax=Rosa chinensis TaxID=74649 RepID=A0A2P6SMB8_ROSCH|nr:hypothetical protein RchiOBHm_Chr1g0374311 [Rosa chinensis]
MYYPAIKLSDRILAFSRSLDRHPSSLFRRIFVFYTGGLQLSVLWTGVSACFASLIGSCCI